MKLHENFLDKIERKAWEIAETGAMYLGMFIGISMIVGLLYGI